MERVSEKSTYPVRLASQKKKRNKFGGSMPGCGSIETVGLPGCFSHGM